MDKCRYSVLLRFSPELGAGMNQMSREAWSVSTTKMRLARYVVILANHLPIEIKMFDDVSDVHRNTLLLFETRRPDPMTASNAPKE